MGLNRILLLTGFTFLFSLITLHSSAQWTLQQCIDYALQHNITIKQSELNVELNQADVTQSTFNFFPTLNGFASNNYFFGRSIDPYTNQFTNSQVRSNSFSLSSSMTLFEGLRLQNILAQSKLNYMASKYDLQKIKNDVSLNVVTAYLQVLYNNELLAVAKQQREATTLQRDRTKRMEELGSASRSNLLDIESQLATDEVTVATAQGQYEVSVLNLKQLLQLDTVKDFSVGQSVINLPTMDGTYASADAIYQTALTTQPDVKSSETKVVSAQKNVSIAKGAMYPRLAANGSLSTTYSTSSQRLNGYIVDPSPLVIGYTSAYDTVFSVVNDRTPVLEDTPFRDQLKDNLGKTVGFTLQIPIFNNWNTQTGIKKARLNLERARLDNELVRQSLYKSIAQAVTEASSAYNRYQAGEKSVEAKQESMKANQSRYDVGLISTYDYLISKNNLARAQADLLQARYDYIFRIKVLDFYMGKPLTF